MEETLKERLENAERIVKRDSLIGDHPVFRREQFDWVPTMEANADKILEELTTFLRSFDVQDLPTLKDLSENQTGHDNWRTIALMACNELSSKTIERFPVTFETLMNIPGVSSGFFSILSPNKHIPPHRGPYGGIIKCHLPLVLPKNNKACWIRVADQQMNWKQGEALIFDDSYDHEVLNGTDDIRIVLLIEFKRPLPPETQKLNDDILNFFQHSDSVQIPTKLYQQWENKAFGY